MKQAIFITGTDTDAGKSYATAWLGNYLTAKGQRVLTQKFIQTGNRGHSEDIDLHRRHMPSLPELPLEMVAPVIFTYPASPHLASAVDGKPIDLTAIDRASEQLLERCDTLLIEGAGGVMVPIEGEYLTIDYIQSRQLPAAVVTNSKLGSINHTLLTLEALRRRNITLAYLLYNTHFDTDPTIAPDTKEYIRRYVGKHFPAATFLEVPTL